jgi:hypothetical protein
MDPMAITLHTDTATLPEQTDLEVGRTRDEFQLKVDKDVEALKNKTANAAWPAFDPAKLFQRYVVGADEKTALRGVIRRAAILHKVEAAFYKDGKTEAGHAVVKFHLSRKLDKDNKPVADTSLDSDGKPVPVVKPAVPPAKP